MTSFTEIPRINSSEVRKFGRPTFFTVHNVQHMANVIGVGSTAVLGKCIVKKLPFEILPSFTTVNVGTRNKFGLAALQFVANTLKTGPVPFLSRLLVRSIDPIPLNHWALITQILVSPFCKITSISVSPIHVSNFLATCTPNINLKELTVTVNQELDSSLLIKFLEKAHLSVLNINGVPDDQFIKALPKFTSLRKLSSASSPSLLESLNFSPNIKKFSIFNEKAEVLVKFIRENSTLESFEFHLVETGNTEIFDALKFNTTLKHLQFSSGQVQTLGTGILENRSKVCCAKKAIYDLSFVRFP